MKILVYLKHPDVAAWTLSHGQAHQHIDAFPPGTDIIVCQNEEEFKHGLQNADGAVVWKFAQEWFALAPRLQWLATPAAGREYLNVRPPDGVKLFFGSFHGELIGETVVGLMLGHCRGLFAAGQLNQAQWPRPELARIMTPLRSSNVVILGYGSIGQWIARLLQPFGVNITGIRRRPVQTPPDSGTMPGESPVRILPVTDLDSVLPEAGHLVLALPGGSATDQILDARRLTLLPPHAAVYNIGRGNAIDEAALASALNAKRIAGHIWTFYAGAAASQFPLALLSKRSLLPHISAIAPNYLDLFLNELGQRLMTANY